MNIKHIIIIVFSLSLAFSSCKKPENGNKITLTSKKHRITERWTMIRGKVGFTEYTNGSAYNSNFEFTQGQGFLTQTGTNIIYTLSYNLYIELKKDGKFSMTEDFNGLMMSADGEWDFNKRSGEKKAKEDIFIQLNEIRSGNPTDHAFNHLVTELSYTIKVLTKDELTMSAKTNYYRSTGEKITIQTEYTFKKQE